VLALSLLAAMLAAARRARGTRPRSSPCASGRPSAWTASWTSPRGRSREGERLPPAGAEGGAEASETTEVRVLYDDTTLYVGVRALDREPPKVIARVLQRDRILLAGLDNMARWAGDDGVAVLLDPFHDHRNAFVFATNANGAEFEALVTTKPLLQCRLARGVAGGRPAHRGRWAAELAIPFRSLRYPTGDGSQPWASTSNVHPSQERADALERLLACGGGLNA